MNEVLNCLLTRRSVKKYLSQPVEKEKLDAVLEAGTYAACGMGRQAGKIVVLQNPDDIAQLERMNAAILGNPDAHPFYGAPVVCVVFADTNVNTWVEDGSLVIGNMMAAAHSLGFVLVTSTLAAAGLYWAAPVLAGRVLHEPAAVCSLR